MSVSDDLKETHALFLKVFGPDEFLLFLPKKLWDILTDEEKAEASAWARSVGAEIKVSK